MMTTLPKQLPLSRIQRLIGGYMLASKKTKANGYLTIRADLTVLNKFRKTYSRQSGVRVTTNDFFLTAMARAVTRHPLFAARIDSTCTHLEIDEHVGVGLAVAAPQGLVVPVIKRAEELTLAELAAASEQLLQKARANKLDLIDFEGENIVLSGLGMFGIETFYAISPISATSIISIGKMQDDFVVVDGQPVKRKMMSVSLAFDQRVIDEVTAAKFLREVIDGLENPETLI